MRVVVVVALVACGCFHGPKQAPSPPPPPADASAPPVEVDAAVAVVVPAARDAAPVATRFTYDWWTKRIAFEQSRKPRPKKDALCDPPQKTACTPMGYTLPARGQVRSETLSKPEREIQLDVGADDAVDPHFRAAFIDDEGHLTGEFYPLAKIGPRFCTILVPNDYGAIPDLHLIVTNEWDEVSGHDRELQQVTSAKADSVQGAPQRGGGEVKRPDSEQTWTQIEAIVKGGFEAREGSSSTRLAARLGSSLHVHDRDVSEARLHRRRRRRAPDRCGHRVRPGNVLKAAFGVEEATWSRRVASLPDQPRCADDTEITGDASTIQRPPRRRAPRAAAD